MFAVQVMGAGPALIAGLPATIGRAKLMRFVSFHDRGQLEWGRLDSNQQLLIIGQMLYLFVCFSSRGRDESSELGKLS